MQPTGTRAMPRNRMSLSKDRVISVFLAWGLCLASWASLAAKQCSPTSVSSARPRPARTMLPEWTGSPGFFSTLSSSPVRRDSSTNRVPMRRMPSAQIWSPWVNSARSPGRISSGETSVRAPSRRTFTGFRASRDSCSTARLARISWKMPMTVLTITTPRKPIFMTELRPISSSTASTRNTRLKKVKQCRRMISFSLFPG